MSYIVIKTIKGKQYCYRQRTYREGGRVRTECIYLGPVGGTPRRKSVPARIGDFMTTNLRREHEHVFDMEALAREEQERAQQKAARMAKAVDELHERYGLTLGPSTPTPIDKPVREVTQPNAPPSAGQQDAPSDVTDGAKAQ